MKPAAVEEEPIYKVPPVTFCIIFVSCAYREWGKPGSLKPIPACLTPPVDHLAEVDLFYSVVGRDGSVREITTSCAHSSPLVQSLGHRLTSYLPVQGSQPAVLETDALPWTDQSPQPAYSLPALCFNDNDFTFPFYKIGDPYPPIP